MRKKIPLIGGIINLIEALKGDIGIVENTDVATHSISAGSYVIWHNELYKASSAIAVDDALSSSNLTAVSGGVGNRFIVETGVNNIGTDGETITFSKTFPDSPVICVTASGATSGIKSPVITARTSTSFTVKVYGSSGAVTSYVNWIAFYERSGS